LPVVEDLPALLEHILPAEELVFARYQVTEAGLEMSFD